jgi:hypothetical protein
MVSINAYQFMNTNAQAYCISSFQANAARLACTPKPMTVVHRIWGIASQPEELLAG